MSVINKMLKDLDHRSDTTGMDTQNSISQNYIPAKKGNINWLLLVMCLIFIALVIIGWQLANTNAGLTQNSDLSASQALAVDSENDQAITESQQSTIVSEVATANSMKALKDKVLSDVESLENQATPELELVTAVNAKSVLPQERLVTAEESGIAEAAQQAKQNSKPEETQQSIEKLPVKYSAQTKKDRPIADQTKKQQSSGQFVIERSNVDLTPEQRVKKLLQTAKKSFDKGYISDGITQLEQLLTMSDGHVEARNLLAGAWYGRGESNQAISILNNGLQRYPNVEIWRLTAAKIFFKENNSAGALSYLDINIADASKEFLTMKGSLGRQLLQFDKSEQAYGQLAKMEPNVGNWWLGLAIAQDSQGKIEQALESYQTLVLKGGVSADSMAFARQRIVELKG